MSLPNKFRIIHVTQEGFSFRDVTKIVELPMLKPKKGEVLVKNRFLGINASDVNYTAGKYGTNPKPPFECGFEGLGEVVAVGDGCTTAVGTKVMYMKFGAFSEYIVLPEGSVFKISKISPEYLPCLVSGSTAAIALDKLGELQAGETVLVTAAAGGTGQFAVQWAKKAGCRVIGTCSSEDKVKFLKELGCDRPVNYKEESLIEVLKEEGGVDVVYESIGGEMFETCVNSLKIKGRMIVIGYISNYGTDTSSQSSAFFASLPQKVLSKSLSVRGFFLLHYRKEIGSYPAKLATLLDEGKLQCFTDNGKNSSKGPFVGLEKVADALAYLYAKKSVGKIVVELR